MDLTWDDFPTFYTEGQSLLSPGTPARELYAWQRELARTVATHGWPSLVAAPTGAGKTVAAWVHVFLNAIDPTAPPRLVHITPRRALVDQMYLEMAELSGILSSDAVAHPVVEEVKRRLRARRTPLVDGSVSGNPLIVDARRGALHAARNREWSENPNACAVITMTPHMAVSSLLFNGFGSSRKSRSVEAGLLGVGTTMVLDEAHIQHQISATLRSASQLASERRNGDISAPTLRVVEMTATPSEDMRGRGTIVSLTEDDRNDLNSHLSRVLTAPKPLTLVEGVPTGDIATTAVDAILNLHNTVGHGAGGRTVGAVLNNVKDALTVSAALSKKGLSVVTLTGKMRGADRERLSRKDFPGVLTSSGNSGVDVIVATQTIEVGVDIDLAGMVTVLASGDALAQRFGRVNRRGGTVPAPITVLIPLKDEKTGNYPQALAGLYGGDVLDDTVTWLKSLPLEGSGVSTLTVYDNPPPVKPAERPVLEHVTHSDVVRMSTSSGQRPFMGENMDLWIVDSLVRRPTADLVIRRCTKSLANSFEDRASLLEALPVSGDEAWSVDASGGKIPAIAKIVKALLDKRASNKLLAVDVISNNGEVSEVDSVEGIDFGWSTVVLWAEAPLPLLTSGNAVEGGKELASWVPEEDLYRNPYTDSAARTHLLLGDAVPVVTEDNPLTRRSSLWESVREAVGDPDTFVNVPPTLVKGERPLWAVASPWNRRESTLSSNNVLLDDHQNDVGRTSLLLAHACGVSGDIAEALKLSGLHHDDGKEDARFQHMLHRSCSAYTEVLAKSTADTREDYRVYGMPQGWRHEQLSASLAYSRCGEHPERDLITILAGMTHGHGRAVFPHGMGTLSSDQHTDAVDIFTDGTWDEILHEQTRRLGPWTLAWLEALLRAADHTVSKQGH